MSPSNLQTICQFIILVGAVLGACGAFGHFHFGQQIEKEKEQTTIREKTKALAAQAKSQEIQHRGKILSRLRKQYILSHDGITPVFASGNAPIPKQWVEEQLKIQGETWRQETYY